MEDQHELVSNGAISNDLGWPRNLDFKVTILNVK